MQKHKYLAIAIGLVAGGLWLALVLYTISVGKNAKTVTPGTMAVSTRHPSPSSVPASCINARPNPLYIVHRTSSFVTSHPSPSASETAPQAAMTSTSMRIHETSSATVHTIGSGIASGGGIATTSGAQKGISYIGLGFGGNMLAMSTSLVLAAPGAKNATDLSSIDNNINEKRSVGPRRVDGPPQIPFPDPLGDIEWGWMILLALGYAGLAWRKKYNAHE